MKAAQLTLFITITACVPVIHCALKSTYDRISEYNYPVEVHIVTTPDDYVIKIFRIPYSPRLQNQNEHRPVAFLQHGFKGCSDNWILNGPDDALPYLLVDAGYDVWLANTRGNVYGRENKQIHPEWPEFWDYSWHEIGIIDLPSMIDYVLECTNETAIHYVGHSQGTTVFFVLLSEMPSYNSKVKTAHMLAPVAFVNHMSSTFVKIFAPLVGQPPPPYGSSFTNIEIEPHSETLSQLRIEKYRTCNETSFALPGCELSNSKNFNFTFVNDYYETIPAGASLKQAIHTTQGYVSGKFRQYDNGIFSNLLKYKQLSPPDYNLQNILAPVHFQYSDSDTLADPEDVKKLEGLMPNLVESYKVPKSDWEHVDFLFGLEVKNLVNDRIIRSANHFEETGKQI